MKRGTGCRIGAVSAAKVTVVMTAAGPTIDAEIHLLDPVSGAALGATRKTRDWPESVRSSLATLLESIELAAADRVFSEPESAGEPSIVDSLEKSETEM